jgi:hypothetical protein
MTQTAWKRRNKSVAIDLAKAGVPLDRILEAHAELSRQRGDTIYMLGAVQDAIARNHRGTPPAPMAKPDWYQTALERGQAAIAEREAL